MSTAIATTPKANPIAVVRDQMEKMGDQFAHALPAHIPVDRFKRVLMTAIQNNPDLVSADRQSLWNSAMRSAQDGLLPDGREGAIVIYNTKVKDAWIKKAQWMPMVFGILKKIRNSGEVASITARVVYGGDTFRYWIDDQGEHVLFEPADSPDVNVVRRVFAMAKTKDGELYVEPLTPADIDKIRNVSRAKDKGPWVDWWEEMAKKSAIRRLAKRLPMSTDLDDLVRRDDELYDFKGDREETRTEGRRPKLVEALDRIGSSPVSREAQDVEQGATSEQASAAEDEVPDFDALVQQFEAEAAAAQSRQVLEAAGAELLAMMEADRLGKDLRTRVENAFADASKRLSKQEKKPAANKAEAGSKTEQQTPADGDDGDGETTVDPDDPDYQRGVKDRAAGQKRCITKAILNDEKRLAAWRAGWSAIDADAEAAA